MSTSPPRGDATRAPGSVGSSRPRAPHEVAVGDVWVAPDRGSYVVVTYLADGVTGAVCRVHALAAGGAYTLGHPADVLRGHAHVGHVLNTFSEADLHDPESTACAVLSAAAADVMRALVRRRVPRVGEPLPDAAVALLARASSSLGWQLAAQRDGADVAAIVCDQAVPWPAAAGDPGHVLLRGHRCAVLPRWQVQKATADAAVELVPALDAPVEAGQLWCLVLWREGERQECLVVPYRPTATPPRAAGPRGSA